MFWCHVEEFFTWLLDLSPLFPSNALQFYIYICHSDVLIFIWGMGWGLFFANGCAIVSKQNYPLSTELFFSFKKNDRICVSLIVEAVPSSIDLCVYPFASTTLFLCYSFILSLKVR